MLYLLIFLLFFGFIQSILELKKDNWKYKWSIEKILSVIYILGFLFGSVELIFKEKESNEINSLIKKISSSVGKLDSNSINQIKELSNALGKTDSLISISKSMNKGMDSIIKDRSSLLAETKNLNSKLLMQNELETKFLLEKEALLDLSDADIELISSDTITYQIKACIRNIGKRNAMENPVILTT